MSSPSDPPNSRNSLCPLEINLKESWHNSFAPPVTMEVGDRKRPGHRAGPSAFSRSAKSFVFCYEPQAFCFQLHRDFYRGGGVPKTYAGQEINNLRALSYTLSAACAALCPHMPCTPPPGAVDAEHRYTLGEEVRYPRIVGRKTSCIGSIAPPMMSPPTRFAS